MFNVTIREVQIKSETRRQLTPVRVASIKKSTDNKIFLKNIKSLPRAFSSLAEAALGLLVVTSSEGFLSPLKPLPFIFKRRREEAR